MSENIEKVTETSEKITIEDKFNKESFPELPRQMREYLVNKASMDLSFAQRALMPGKNLRAAYAYVKDKAKKRAVNGVAAIEDSEVYSWLEEYYLNDKVEALKPLNINPKATTSTPETKPTHIQKKETVKEPDPAPDHQMTLFDFGEA